MSRFHSIVVCIAFVSGVMLGPRLTATVYGQFRTANTVALAKTDLGDWCAGKEVTVEVQDYGAGTSGPHYHPAYSFAYVINGVQVKSTQGRAVTTPAGQIQIEAPMEVHETVSSEPAKVLVLRIAEKGKPATVRVP
jgi:hypothetical protein